jgi:hypothetical protein
MFNGPRQGIGMNFGEAQMADIGQAQISKEAAERESDICRALLYL